MQYKFQDEHRRLYLYAALFLPFRSMAYMDRKSKMVSRFNLLMLYLKGVHWLGKSQTLSWVQGLVHSSIMFAFYALILIAYSVTSLFFILFLNLSEWSNYQVPVTSFIFRDSLKLKASDAEMVRILTPLTSYISCSVANFSVPQSFIFL